MSKLVWGLAALALCAGGCGGSGGGGAPGELAAVPLGEPIPGLSAAERASFFRGKEVFDRRFRRSEGHGPHFNTSSCKSCHEIPVSGGSSPLYRNFFLVGDNGTLTPVLEDDQLVARLFSYTRAAREAIPAGTEVVAQRNAPPIFGTGLFESIPDDDIRANADPFDSDLDGVSGTFNLDGGRVGRLGYKAQEANVEDFVRGPIFNHMGITTDPLSEGPQVAGLRAEPQVSAPDRSTTDDDGVPDPELSFEDLFDLVTYTRLLAPPAPLPHDEQSLRGERVFDEIGCAKCHIENIVRNGAPIRAYTDLLLHDMGPGLADGVRMRVAQGFEFRTQPLWGLRHHAPFLHDGRADTIEDAITWHGGEATGARNAFLALDAGDRADLMRFLETR